MSGRTPGPAQGPAGSVLAFADARPEAGLGHLARSSAVIRALQLHGVQTRCVALGADTEIRFDGISWIPDANKSEVESPGVSAVLLDSYILTESDQAPLGPVARFYDGNRPEPSSAAQIVIAPASEPQRRAGWLSGLTYACLRPVFWGVHGVEPTPTAQTVLVTTGATDPQGVSATLLDAVLDALGGVEVRHITGPGCQPSGRSGVVDVHAPADLRAELQEIDLVVCLGGQTALEAACLGVPTLAVAINENQTANVAQLAAAGAVESALLDGDLGARIETVGTDAAKRALMSRSARQAVDGFGALRVAAHIESLFGPHR